MTGRNPFRRITVLTAAAAGACIALSSCATTVSITGQATSPLYDPYRVAGIPATDGPSGVRADAPEPSGDVANTDGSDADHVALLGVNDVEEFWTQAYTELPGSFDPITTLVSYDSNDPDSPSCAAQKPTADPTPSSATPAS